MKCAHAALVMAGVLLLGCIQPVPGGNELPANAQKVFFQTNDNVKIAANFFPAQSKKAVICLHQFNSSKEAYNDLAKKLNQSGFAVLSIDLRGHGQSKGSGSLLSPASLQDSDFQNMEWDVLAGQQFLMQKGFSQFFLVGASIGANLAIIVPAKNPGFSAAVALSPGEDYKSLQPLSAARNTTVPTLVVASQEDAYSFQSTQSIYNALPAPRKKLDLNNAGHGTAMLEKSPQVQQAIVDWLLQNSK